MPAFPQIRRFREHLSICAGLVFFFPAAGEASDTAYLKASNAEATDRFGYSVAVDGNTVVVGAITESSRSAGINGDESDDSLYGSGAAYVFVKTESGWRQQAYLKASNPGDGDSFGGEVDICGDTIVVSAGHEDSRTRGINGDGSDNLAENAGAAYVFVRDGENWTQQAYLKASNAGEYDGFGLDLAISGDTIVVSAVGEDSNAAEINGNQADNSFDLAGAAYVFVRNGENWTQQAYLKPADSQPSLQFGHSVDIDGDTIVVGTPFHGPPPENDGASNLVQDGSGLVYVFSRVGTEWIQDDRLRASNSEENDTFGFEVSVDGETVVVGAPGEDSGTRRVNGDEADNSKPDSGAAYVFVREEGTWTQQAYLKTWNPDEKDFFARSVSVSGDLIAVGAVGEDSRSRGINENGADNTVKDSGAVYVFSKDGGEWRQRAYQKAWNSDINDGFGTVVAIDGSTLVASTYSEDSSATGIGGDDTDNSAEDSGAAFVFPLDNLPEFRSAPRVLIKGKARVRTRKTRYVLQGAALDAEDDLNFLNLSGSGFLRSYPLKSGTNNWEHVVRLKPGRNTFKASAIDFSGLSSIPSQVIILRK